MKERPINKIYYLLIPFCTTIKTVSQEWKMERFVLFLFRVLAKVKTKKKL